MNLITFTAMVCMTVNNSYLFCKEAVSSRIEVSVPKREIMTLQQQPYYFLKDLSAGSITEAIYGKTQVTDKDKMQGCMLTTKCDKTFYYEFPCNHLKKVIKGQ